jgi:hypothetical protein
MVRKNLHEDILRDPARFYRVPSDVLRDRRFSDAERVAILRAWMVRDESRAAEIGPALTELENREIRHAAQ